MANKLDSRKHRIVISTIIITFYYALATVYIQHTEERIRRYNLYGQSWTLILLGCIVSCISAFFTSFSMFDENNCRILFDSCAFFQIVGALIYLIGWLWYIGAYRQLLADNVTSSFRGFMIIWFGEAFLPTSISILIAIDKLKDYFKTHKLRSIINCSILFITSIICAVGYIHLPSSTSKAISAGYFVMWFATLMYIVLCIISQYFNVNIKAIDRKVNAVILIIASIIVAVGYFVYSMDVISDRTDGITVSYFISLSSLVIAFSTFCAIDIWPASISTLHSNKTAVVVNAAIQQSKSEAPPVHNLNKIVTQITQPVDTNVSIQYSEAQAPAPPDVDANTAVNNGEGDGLQLVSEGKFDIKNFFHYEVKLDEYNEQYIEIFIQSGFDKLNTITYITDEELIDVGIVKKGHRLAIIAAVKRLDTANGNVIQDGKVTNY